MLDDIELEMTHRELAGDPDLWHLGMSGADGQRRQQQESFHLCSPTKLAVNASRRSSAAFGNGPFSTASRLP